MESAIVLSRNEVRPRFLIFLVFFFLLMAINGMSQDKRAYIWGMRNTVLDFNSGVGVVKSVSPLLYRDILSDSEGKLQLYTKNDSLIDSHHKGFDLRTNTYFFYVPKPNTNAYMYILMNKDFHLINLHTNSIVEKNIVWDQTAEENSFSFEVIGHSNCSDYWVLKIKNGMVEEYLIDKDGVHFVKQINIPIIRSIDISISGSKVMLRRIVNNQLNLVYCHFDTSNGQLTELSSFAFPLVHTMYNWSGCFSPDETKYYWSAMTMVNGKWSNRVDLMQIPLENNMPQFAKNTIFKSFVTTGLVYANEMKNGPDGKIYILSGFKHKIHKINSPNLLSTNCEFVENFHNECSSTFPYVATWSAPFPCKLSLVVSNFCHTEVTQFSIENGQSIQSYLWNFGDGHTSTEAEPSHVYENTGKYSVTLEILKSDNSTENISKKIEIIEKPLKPVIVKSSD